MRSLIEQGVMERPRDTGVQIHDPEPGKGVVLHEVMHQATGRRGSYMLINAATRRPY